MGITGNDNSTTLMMCHSIEYNDINQDNYSWEISFFLPLIVNSVNLQNLIDLIINSSSTVHSWFHANGKYCFTACWRHPLPFWKGKSVCFFDVDGLSHNESFGCCDRPCLREDWCLPKWNTSEVILNLQNISVCLIFIRKNIKSESYHLHIISSLHNVFAYSHSDP